MERRTDTGPTYCVLILCFPCKDRTKNIISLVRTCLVHKMQMASIDNTLDSLTYFLC
jgi:hypothetical protein